MKDTPTEPQSVVTAGAKLAGAALLFCAAGTGVQAKPSGPFVSVANYEVAGESAEIVTSTPDGNLLIYTDAVGENIGFVDITDVDAPVEELMPLDGGPTSVAVTPDGQWAIVVVHDGEDEIDSDNDPETPPDIEPARDYLLAFDLSDMSETLILLGGQPDSIAISPDGQYAAICIENERNEEVEEGLMPQDPPGFLTIVDLVGAPADWTFRDVSFTGLKMRFPTDPEPEFVDINSDNQAAVTLQENNHIAIVNLEDGTIEQDFTAGTTTHSADLIDDDVVRFNNKLKNARLEPDGIAWTPNGSLITANEGDYDLDLADGEFVGGRNWSIFSTTGTVLYDSGVHLERAAAQAGLYPDGRSDAKGVEPEGVEVATFGGAVLAFIGAERGNFVGVYQLKESDENTPRLLQILETGDRPEGLLAIPGRDLFLTSNEGDATISIFRHQ
jgi:DNA-binding beta-propeller fold protein YncE